MLNRAHCVELFYCLMLLLMSRFVAYFLMIASYRFTYIPSTAECTLYADCATLDESCSDCISGQSACKNGILILKFKQFTSSVLLQYDGNSNIKVNAHLN